MKMKTSIKLSILFILMINISGCTYMGFGENQTYCQEHGRNFKDAGVCGDTYEIFKNLKRVKKSAYGYSSSDEVVELENIHTRNGDITVIKNRSNR